jgi:hypothetical protein
MMDDDLFNNHMNKPYKDQNSHNSQNSNNNTNTNYYNRGPPQNDQTKSAFPTGRDLNLYSQPKTDNIYTKKNTANILSGTGGILQNPHKTPAVRTDRSSDPFKKNDWNFMESNAGIQRKDSGNYSMYDTGSKNTGGSKKGEGYRGESVANKFCDKFMDE